MSSFQKISKEDDPAELSLTAAKNEALLQHALFLARRKAARRKAIIREILQTGKVEGLSATKNFKLSSISFKVKKYNCSWVISMPWTLLIDTTPEELALLPFHSNFGHFTALPRGSL